MDIACGFKITASKSSLAPLIRERKHAFIVNAFHGYSHNAACQSKNHPNVTEGIGIEDLETMERIFSASNHLAAITRYAAGFQRRLLIDLFFQQWDSEKYANLATMLFNNYKQALEIIASDGPALKESMLQLGLAERDLEQWADDERTYLRSADTEDKSC